MAFTAACTLGTPAAGESLTDQNARMGIASHATVVGGATGITSRSGIIPSGGSPLSVVQIPTPSMNVRVAPGTCVVQSTVANGGVYSGTLETQTDIQVNAAHATLPRIDVLVMEVLNDGTSATMAQLRWVVGTAAASPTRPSTTPPTNSHYVPIAQVTVPAAATTIVTANITLTTADGLFTAGVGGSVKVATLAAAAGLPVGTPFFDEQDDMTGVVRAGGSAELLPGMRIRYFNGVVSTNAGGDISVAFGMRIAGAFVATPFPGGILGAVGNEADPGLSGNVLILKSTGGTASVAFFRVFNSADGIIVSSSIRVAVIAVGY